MNAQVATETAIETVKTLAELQAEKAALDAAIEAARKEERKGDIQTIESLLRKHGMESHTLSAKKASAATGKKVAPKYKDPLSEATWTGRGKQPKWFNAETAIKL